MGQSRISVLAVACAAWLLLCGRSAGEAAPSASGLGFASALGIGATARTDPSAALFENPSLLTGLTRRESWMSGSTGEATPALRFSFAAPLLSGPAWGLGYGARDGASIFSLGGARSSAGRMSWGSRLDLLTRNEGSQVNTDFDLDLGWHWRPWAPVDAGVVVSHTLGSVESREVRTALAWTQPLGTSWSFSASTGLRAIDGEQPRMSVAAVLRRRQAELAGGIHDGWMRLGAAYDGGPWRLGYAYSRDDGGTHEVALQLRLGASLQERREAAIRKEELEIASQVVRQSTRLEAARLVEWRKAAEAAASRGAFERAAGYYAAVLVLQPQDPSAHDGLRRMRHDTWVQMADSLLLQENDAAAVLALEQALQVLPEDSLTASRLQELRHAAMDANRVRDKVARLFDTGLLAFAQQRHLDAVHAFDEVLRLDPEHPTAATYRQQAQHALALSERNALRSARQSLQAGDFEEAQSHVRRVLAADPHQTEARALLLQIDAQTRTAQERTAQATEKTMATAPAEDAAPVVPAFVAARYEEGIQLMRASDLLGAMQAWEEVARAAPGYQEVNKNLMRVYRVTGLESYMEGRLREAVEIWQKARRLDPEDEQLRRYLDQANAKLARTEGPGR